MTEEMEELVLNGMREYRKHHPEKCQCMHGDGSGDPGCNLDAKTLKAIKEADINFIMWCSRCLDWEEKMKKGFTVTCSDEEWESFKRSPFKGGPIIKLR